jgi:GNAT superfamily N-acetyltransferase
MSHDIRPITPAQVRQLRHRLLRPFEPPEQIVYHGDDDADTLHAGAFVDGVLVGIASVCREAMPATRQPPRLGPEVWRLRGMATTPEVRGAGHGRALLEACFDHIRARGGDLLWCNARVVALGFYERLGFVAEGPEFEIVPIGPHFVMTKDLQG